MEKPIASAGDTPPGPLPANRQNPERETVEMLIGQIGEQ
jgi:hypothetical protein